ncbi:MAG: histidine--tRNA ligase [Bacteroidia bacterium]|nr:MAG: histidine--tRNA ligase [Bacteroidia bacterium]
MAQKSGIPKGTRDFSPTQMVRRNYIFDTIKNIFQRYGYLPIETPAMETLDTLLGKYGEEGDKLLFRILNSGDYLSKVDENLIKKTESVRLSGEICEKGLRYDLTVPFARFVVQHRNDIRLPFKRYQIQPVWRADKPQKGRYREFYQCDVDVIGSNALLNEIELIQIIDEVFKALKINTVTKINNRKILAGIAEIIKQPDKMLDISIAIDKIDKIGKEKVLEELKAKAIPDEAIEKLKPILNFQGNSAEKIKVLKETISGSEIGMKGIEEVEYLFDYLSDFKLNTEVELDLTLARGLNYYTGAIFEVKVKDFQFGSICGGGRYDDLTGIFGMKDISGVGISFGADRIYDILNEFALFPAETVISTKLMFVNFGTKEEKHCIALLQKIREAGINAEIYPEAAKMKKQMNYANKKQVPFVALVGKNEMEQSIINLKDMNSGKQMNVTLDELICALK